MPNESASVARELGILAPGVERRLAEFEPFIRYHTFGESSIDFSVIMRGKEFGDAF